MILWFADRFGMPGKFYHIWARAVTEQKLDPRRFRIVSLHRVLRGQLLQKHGTRKAPTWIPERADEIIAAINSQIQTLKPKAVILAAPEALAYLGMSQDSATLHTLRGSVYWRHGIPFLVTLPISAWNAMVTQKDIGAANYGFESSEAFASVSSAGNAAQRSSQSETQIDGDGADDESIDDSVGEASLAVEEGDGGDDESGDHFFYEPVLSPVGRFTITADLGKLSRILQRGRHSSGLMSPIQLRW